MTVSIFSDWQALKNGTADPDPFEFSGLIRHDISETLLYQLFGDLRGGRTLIDKIKKLLSENLTGGMYVVPSLTNRLDQGSALALADEYSKTVAKFLETISPEIADEPLVSAVEIVRDNEKFLEISGDPERGISEANDEIQHSFDDAMSVLGEVQYGLWEAVYALTNYPAITRWLIEDMIDFPMSSQTYYQLWRGSADIAFMKARRIVLVE